MNKTKAAGFGIVAVIVALAAIGLSKLFDRGGGFGIGVTGSPALTSSTSKGESGAEMGTLVITVDGDQYIVDGRPRSLDDVVSAAKARAKNPSDQSGSQILVKKKGNARYMTVQKLEEEFERHGIRYRSEKDF